jgi:hypothetical protein
MSKKEKATKDSLEQVPMKRFDFTKTVTPKIHLSFLHGLHEIYVEQILSINDKETGAATSMFRDFDEYIKLADDSKKQEEIAQSWDHETKKLFTLFMLINILSFEAEKDGHIIDEKKMVDSRLLKDWSKEVENGNVDKAAEFASEIMKIYNPDELS